jgi:aspartate/methionine/tyrosine aminotransferase
VKISSHKLFEYLLATTESKPEAVLGFSLARSPRLREFSDALDPGMSLDWSNESFQGKNSLRQNILARSSLTQHCDIADVLVTAGTAEANYLAIMQLLQPTDEIIVESPGWPQALVLARAIGADIKVLRRREEASWTLDMAALEDHISSKTKVIFLTNPNNPTGQVLTRQDLEQIVTLADRVGAYVLVDEVYAGLEWQAERAPSVAALYERGITTNSVSKALGLQGLRTGWLICRDKGLIRDAMILRENSSEIMNVMGEAIADIALGHDRYQSMLAQARAEGQTNLSTLDNFIRSRAELSWQPPVAGLIGMCRLQLDVDAESFAKRLLEPPYRTFVIPGHAYELPQHIRLGVGGGLEARLDLGLERLALFLDDLGA